MTNVLVVTMLSEVILTRDCERIICANDGQKLTDQNKAIDSHLKSKSSASKAYRYR
jgi:hypothetical protein